MFAFSKTSLQNQTKEEIALNELTVNFTTHLLDCMQITGFCLDDLDVGQSTFNEFMQHALFELIQKVKTFKSSANERFSMEEQNCYAKLNIFQNQVEIIVLEPKMQNALQHMKEDFPKYVKEVMLRSGYSRFEVEKSQTTYANLLSKVVISETEKLLRFKSILDRQMKNNQPKPSRQEKIKLIRTTTYHHIYHDPAEDVLIKVLKSSNPPAKHVKKLNNELNITKRVSHPSITLPTKRIKFDGNEALVLKRADGYPISDVKNLPLKDFLTISREIVVSLLAMHMKNIMHMNLTCEHILYCPVSKAIQIIGCSSATSFDSTRNYLTNSDFFEKDMHCVSPEQTGRLGRDIDHRSDFYSLGIIFYRLIAGKYPFDSSNALELINMHVCKEPIPVNEIDENIPIIIARMISKLLQKDADERYYSAKGIIYDIDLMLSEFETDQKLNKISSTSLAQHDIQQTLFVSQKLYGRSEEYNTLLSTLENVASKNTFELVLVGGASGTGM